MNEAIQWGVLALLGLLVLGLYRQAAFVSPRQLAAQLGGPAIGKRLPGVLLDQVTGPLSASEAGRMTLAFLTENCAGCHRLLASLESLNGGVDRKELTLVLRDPSEQFRKAVEDTGVPVVFDANGEIWRACNVTATPLVVSVRADGRVETKEVTHDVGRVRASA